MSQSPPFFPTGHNTPTLQTDRQIDRQTDRQTERTDRTGQTTVW